MSGEIGSPSSEYQTARSRTPSFDSATNGHGSNIAPLSGDGRYSFSVSSNSKRDHKDKRIYVNNRTGLPVRPPTSFGLFKHALRRNMKGKISFLDFNKKATLEWGKMSETAKKPYTDRAKALSERFKEIEVQFLRKKLRELQRQIRLDINRRHKNRR